MSFLIFFFSILFLSTPSRFVFLESSKLLLCSQHTFKRLLSHSATNMATPHPRVRVAILDDYQGVALTSADWSPLKDRVTINVFRDTLHGEDALVERLKEFEIICAMRERTKFPRSLLDRLPNLKCVVISLLMEHNIV